jgi:virginiamycin B lyase
MKAMSVVAACATAWIAATGTATAAAPGAVRAFGLSAGSGPEQIAAGADGNLWFTDRGAGGGYGRITTAGVPRSFPRAAGASSIIPQDVTFGPDGNVWLAGNTSIRRITPDGRATERSRRGAAAITLGPDGALWLLSSATVSRLTPRGAVTDLAAGLAPGDLPRDLAAAPDGNLWYTSLGTVPAIRRLTRAGLVTAFWPGVAGTFPGGIAAGADGNMWFTDGNLAGPAIGRITPSGAVTRFALRMGSNPQDIAPGPDGNMWFTDPGTQTIGRITVDGAITAFPTGLASRADPTGITAGPDGGMWFTAPHGSRAAIGVIGTGAPAARVASPRIAGRPRVGSRLVCRGDRWAPWAGPHPRSSPLGRYGWRRDGKVLDARRGPAYTPTARDVGHRITCTASVTYPLLLVTVSTASKPVVVRARTTPR